MDIAHEEPMLVHVGARVGDHAEMEKLFAVVPSELRSRVESGGFFQHWHTLTRRDLWIAGNGEVVQCVMIEGLNPEQAADVRKLFDALGDDALFGDMKQLAHLVAEVTGRPMHEAVRN
jgi:hypothetical protein